MAAVLAAIFVLSGLRAVEPVRHVYSRPPCGPLTREGVVVGDAGPCPTPPLEDLGHWEWSPIWEHAG
jgi:hypothetical protein